MNIEVALVLVSVSLDKEIGTRCFVLKREDGKYQLPTFPLHDMSSLECASRILEELTFLKAKIFGVGWVDLVQCPLVDRSDRIVDEQRLITIPYGAMIPYDSAIRTNQNVWLTTAEVFSSEMYLDHKDIFQAVCLKI